MLGGETPVGAQTKALLGRPEKEVKFVRGGIGRCPPLTAISQMGRTYGDGHVGSGSRFPVT